MRRYLFMPITKYSICRTNHSIVFLNILFYTVKEVMKMLTYRTLYHLMVRSMSEAIDLYDAGKGILAREVMQKALLDAEEQVIAHDIIPDEPVGSADSAEN